MGTFIYIDGFGACETDEERKQADEQCERCHKELGPIRQVCKKGGYCHNKKGIKTSSEL